MSPVTGNGDSHRIAEKLPINKQILITGGKSGPSHILVASGHRSTVSVEPCCCIGDGYFVGPVASL